MDHVYITGTVNADGRLTAGWWSTPPLDALASLPVTPESRTSWQAVALDDANHVLARARVALIDVPICSGASRVEFSGLLAVPESTSAVAILDGEQEMLRRAVPAPARVILEQRLDRTLARELIEVPCTHRRSRTGSRRLYRSDVGSAGPTHAAAWIHQRGHGRTRSRTPRLAGASRRRRMPSVGRLLRRNPHHDHVHRSSSPSNHAARCRSSSHPQPACRCSTTPG